MPAITDSAADNLLITLMLTPDGRADPYPLYRELRDAAPVLRSGLGLLALVDVGLALLLAAGVTHVAPIIALMLAAGTAIALVQTPALTGG